MSCGLSGAHLSVPLCSDGGCTGSRLRGGEPLGTSTPVPASTSSAVVLSRKSRLGSGRGCRLNLSLLFKYSLKVRMTYVGGVSPLPRKPSDICHHGLRNVPRRGGNVQQPEGQGLRAGFGPLPSSCLVFTYRDQSSFVLTIEDQQLYRCKRKIGFE